MPNFGDQQLIETARLWHAADDPDWAIINDLADALERHVKGADLIGANQGLPPDHRISSSSISMPEVTKGRPNG